MEEKKLNENLILMIGKATLAKELKLGEDCNFSVHASVLKKERIDNQDGTYDILHKVKIITVDSEE